MCRGIWSFGDDGEGHMLTWVWRWEEFLKMSVVHGVRIWEECFPSHGLDLQYS